MKPPGKASLGSLFKDKRVLAAAAVAGGLGLVVLLRKGGDVAGGGSDGGQTITPADYNSTGVDSYNAISQIGQAWGDQFAQYTDQLGSLIDQLGGVNGPPSGSPARPVPTAPTTPTRRPAPSTSKPAPPRPVSTLTRSGAAQYVKTTAYTKTGTRWNSTLSGIASRYHTSVPKLMKLNPNIRNANLIHPNQQIRVR